MPGMHIYIHTYIYTYIYIHTYMHIWRNSPTRARAASVSRFLDHTKWHTTVDRTPPDGGSARRRNLCLTAYNTYNRHTSMIPAGFELVIPAS